MNATTTTTQQVPEGRLIDLTEEPDFGNVNPTPELDLDVNHLKELNAIKESDLPLYSMVCNGTPVTVLLDTGASTSYISPRICKHMTHHLVQGREVETAGGHTMAIKSLVSFDLSMADGYTHPWKAYVFDTKFDIILGRDWFKHVQPIPDWRHDTWQIKQGNHTHILTPSRKRQIPDLAYLLSHREMQRLSRTKAISEMYLFYTADKIDKYDGTFDTLVHEYADVFRNELPGLPPDRDIEHVIDTGDAQPINRHPFKMSPLELDELRRQLAELQTLGLIEPSNSPWGAPVLFVRKKDGSMRLCIDYRALNAVTRRNAHPLPRIDECLERLGGARFFSSIDLKSGYHQVRIRPEDVPKTAFNTRYGAWQWKVLPFGLTNAPPTFQKMMNSILGDFLDKFALVYLDDILIFSRTKEDHLKHVRMVLDRLRAHKLYANLKKCEFNKTELEFVGFQVSAQGILPSKSKVKAIQEWPIPTNVQEVRQFIGLASHYRRFIRGFSTIAAPLTDLTKGSGSKTRLIEWTPECQSAFEEIQSRMIQAPTLVPPNAARPFVIETDASDFGVGAVLLQEGDDGELHPLAFESKKLSSAERNYPAQERELLGILHALRSWRCFIEGRSYKVYTDHHPLKYFRSQRKPTPRLTRWIAEMELYDPDIQYKPGKDNHVPDILSRRDGAHCLTNESDMEPEYLYATRAIQESDWPKFYLRPEEKWPSSYADLLRKHREQFVVRNDMVFRKVKVNNTLQEVRFAMFSRRADIVQEIHKAFGHPGMTTMQDLVRKRWWWPNMKQDIQEWIAQCSQCQLAAGADRNNHHAPMHLTEIPPAFSRWHLDFIGELPTTTSGNRWILVAVDYTTNWPIARAVPDATSEAIAKFIHEEIVMRFGCPDEIVTDRGANFMGKFLDYYLGRLKAKHNLTSAFHPRSNGKVERTNGILKSMLRKYVHGEIHRWDDFLDTALFACRIRKHRTTQMSPFFMVYGQDPKLPGDPLRPLITADEPQDDPQAHVSSRLPTLRSLRDARAQAITRMQKDREKDKAQWDLLTKKQVYSVGDFVLLRHENKFGLEYNWRGPYKIVERNLDTDIYKLHSMNGEAYKSWVHTDRLRPIHINKADGNPDTWYDPTATRARWRQLTDAANTIASVLVEGDQDFREGVLS